MRKQRMRSVSSWVEVERDELRNYASRLRRVCTSCGAESFLTVSPPVWPSDLSDTRCLDRQIFRGACGGVTIAIKESWRLLKQEVVNGKSV